MPHPKDARLIRGLRILHIPKTLSLILGFHGLHVIVVWRAITHNDARSLAYPDRMLCHAMQHYTKVLKQKTWILLSNANTTCWTTLPNAQTLMHVSHMSLGSTACVHTKKLLDCT